MRVLDWDDFEARWYIRLKDYAPADSVANGFNLWRHYYAIKEQGDHEDHMVVKGISVIRALFGPTILMQLAFTGAALPDCIMSYEASNVQFTYTPASIGEQDKLNVQHRGWEFDITVQKEGQ
jgi:hypothetical protein